MSMCTLMRLAEAGAAADPGAPGSAYLTRVRHEQNVLPDQDGAGFGSLLYDEYGALVLHGDHKTWLYTTGLYERAPGGRRDWYGKWVSYVREFDVGTHVSGPKTVTLGLSGTQRWAVIHDVLKIDEDFYVAFYSANGTVRAAIARVPEGPFAALPDFQIRVTDDWEKAGGSIDSLESNGAHVLIEDFGSKLTLWLGYDSYHVDATAGQLGWAKIAIDKSRRSVELLEKHPDNPLAVLPPNYIAARCGGNLSSSVRLGGKHVLFYYTRPDTKRIMLTFALSDDPLFQRISQVVEFEPPLGDELVIEKFESYLVGDTLHVIYENKLTSGHWGTGIREYKVLW